MRSDPCRLDNTYLSGYVGGSRQGFASTVDAFEECLKGATFYRNKYLGIQIAKLHTQQVVELLLQTHYILPVLTEVMHADFIS